MASEKTETEMRRKIEADYYRRRIRSLGRFYPGCSLITQLIKEAEKKGIKL